MDMVQFCINEEGRLDMSDTEAGTEALDISPAQAIDTVRQASESPGQSMDNGDWSVKQAAELMGVSEKTIRRHLKDGACCSSADNRGNSGRRSGLPRYQRLSKKGDNTPRHGRNFRAGCKRSSAATRGGDQGVEIPAGRCPQRGKGAGGALKNAGSSEESFLVAASVG